MKIKKILYIFIGVLFFVINFNTIFAIDNQDIDVLKYRNYRINIYNYNNKCKDYTTIIQNKEMGNSEVSIVNKYYLSSLVIRGDEANTIKTFTIKLTCPIPLTFGLVYSLYDNGNLNIFINECGLKNKKEYYYLSNYNTFKIEYNDKYGEKQNICIYYPNTVSNFKVLGYKNTIINTNNIVLANKLGLNNSFISISIGLLLFILTLAVILWRKGFQI